MSNDTEKKTNTYKNRHVQRDAKTKTYDKFPYSLPSDKWLSVEDIYKEFEHKKEDSE